MLVKVELLDIMIVDDSAEDAKAIGRQLRSLSTATYVIREEKSPVDALRACRINRPDCLLLDLLMPELDGLEFLARLRDAGLGFPIVVLTGVKDDHRAIQALRSGAQDYLIKGETTPELLSRAIYHARERFRIGQELARSEEKLRSVNGVLRDNVERLQAIFGQTGVGIAQTTPDGRFTQVNDAFCSLTGRGREEVLALRLEDLTGAGAKRESLCEEDQDVRYVRPGQEAIWVRETISLAHDAEGNPTSKVILARNITARKSAEAAQALLASIVEASADAMIFHDRNGIIRAWNMGAEKTYGYTSAEMVGKPFSALLPVDRLDDWCRMSGEAIDAHPVQGQESVRICKNGYRLSVAATLSAVRDRNGEVVGFSCIERDISGRKRAEEDLRKSEARYRMLANAMPQIVYTANSDGERDFINQQWPSYTGCQAEDGLTFDWLEYVHAEDRQAALSGWRNALHHKIPYQTEYRLERADGEYRWHLSRAFPVKDGEGEVTGWIGTSTDIHDRKLTEASLQITLECLRLAQSAAGVVVWDLDLRRDRYAESREFYEQFEFEPGTAVGFQDWLGKLDPDDRERIIEVVRNPERYRDGIELEFRVVRNDGSIRWLLGRGSTILDGEGRPVRVTGVNVDITERKLAETAARDSRERLHFALTAARMGTWELDLSSGRINCSDKVGPLFGDPEGPIQFDLDGFLQRVHHAEREAVASQIRESVAKDIPYAVEFRVVWADGTVHWLESQGAVMRSPSGEPLRMIGVARDVTPRRELEQKLAQAMKFESIGVLAAGVAHDFNNLLVGVVGSASLAQDMLPAEHEASKLLCDVVEAGQRAATLTSQMLAYSGKAQFRAQPIDVSMLAKEAAEMIRPILHLGAELVVRCLPGSKVLGDAAQIRQSIVNLLTNASEALHQGGGRIEVRVKTVEVSPAYIEKVLKNADISSGTFIKIEVEDNGSGIDESIKDRVFDPFFSTKFMGRGLGLAAVAGIVRVHQGVIHLTSNAAGGTTVEVFLPAMLPVATGRITSFSAGDHRVAGAVLVVDDEHMVASLVKRVLEARAYRVLVAHNGESALGLIRGGKEPISVVLLDLTMPGINGVETLRRIRQIDQDVPVILSSGYSEEYAMSEVDSTNISGFLQKPYSARDLLKKISEFLAHRDEASAQPF